MTFLDDISSVIDLILKYGDKLTVAGLLLLLVVALWQEWLVPGPRYRAKVQECDSLRAASDRLLASYQERERLEYEDGRRKASRRPRTRPKPTEEPKVRATLELEGGAL